MSGQPADDRWWRELTVTALLGTDRRPPGSYDRLPGGLAVAAARLTADAPGRLLDTAALAVAYRRGGARAERAGDDRNALRPAPADERPWAARAAGARLAELIAAPDLELVAFWCSSAAQVGRLAPPELLPDLLALATRQPILRAVVTGVLGERGRWLAGLRPVWEWAATGDEPGRRADRWAWLRAADETALEQALDDPDNDVRRAAAEVLAGRPDSAYSGRMRRRARTLVRRGPGGRLLVAVPDRIDPTAHRDGITDRPPSDRVGPDGGARRRWWLEQVVAATPLDVWADYADGPAAALAAPVVPDDQGDPRDPGEPNDQNDHDERRVRDGDRWRWTLHAGWARAAARQRNRAWAVALLATPARSGAPDLLALLDGDELARAVRYRLRRFEPAQAQLVADLLATCPAPWPDRVADDVLTWLGRSAARLPPRAARPLLNLMAYRFPIQGRARLAAAVDGLPLDDPWRPVLRSVTGTVSLRATIHEELR